MGCFTAALTGANDIGSGLSSQEPMASVSGGGWLSGRKIKIIEREKSRETGIRWTAT